MHKEESRTDLGIIRIHKNVFSSIASLAAIEIDGVKSIGGDFKSGILELVGRRPLSAIRVEIDKNDEVRFNIPIIVKYGFSIPDLANRVQENVRNALEKMTSLSTKEIDINVQGIERG